MQIRDHVDERRSDRRPLLATVRIASRQRVAPDVADDPLHHVEAHAERAVGSAEVQDARHRHGRPVERLQDAVLAHHVVRGREDVAQWGRRSTTSPA